MSMVDVLQKMYQKDETIVVFSLWNKSQQKQFNFFTVINIRIYPMIPAYQFGRVCLFEWKDVFRAERTCIPKTIKNR